MYLCCAKAGAKRRSRGKKRNTDQIGKMPEWSIGTVSKTVVPLRVPRVRIPVFPQKAASRAAFFVESRDENPGRVRDRLRRFRSSAEKVIALALGSTKNPCLSANNPSNTAVGQILTAVIILYTYKNTYKFRGNPRPIQKHQYHKKSRRIRQKT